MMMKNEMEMVKATMGAYNDRRGRPRQRLAAAGEEMAAYVATNQKGGGVKSRRRGS